MQMLVMTEVQTTMLITFNQVEAQCGDPSNKTVKDVFFLPLYLHHYPEDSLNQSHEQQERAFKA